MKVLWFSINSSLYISQNGTEAGHGGWIGSLERIVRSYDDFQLAIAFEHEDDIFKKNQNGVTYYPMKAIKNNKEARLRYYDYTYEVKQILPCCLKVIDDFQPDIIQIFGSEWCYGLLVNYTKIPIVIHIQGSIPPYQNSALPPGVSTFSIQRSYGVNIKKWFGYFIQFKNEQRRKEREEKILSSVHYYMGRTEWDYNLTRLYNPTSKYFFCNEALNPLFVNTDIHWKIKKSNKIILLTVGSHFLKGIDVVYKTAALLQQHYNNECEWRIVGGAYHDCKVIEKSLKVDAEKLGIKFLGYLTPEKIKKELLSCDFYVHPSYAENSPNSLCEAQIMGVPIIATYCGGIPSLVIHKKTGLLISTNDPYSLSSIIIQLKNDADTQNSLSANEIEVAKIRHNPTSIYNSLLLIYKEIVQK